jgi:dienelactone hydrolase
MYDFGEDGNVAHYGQPTPPAYNLNNIKMPVSLFVGGADALADPADAQILKTELTGS